MYFHVRETPAKKKSNTEESSLSLEDTGVTRITPIEQDIKSVVLFVCVCMCMYDMLVPQFCLFVCCVVHFSLCRDSVPFHTCPFLQVNSTCLFVCLFVALCTSGGNSSLVCLLC